MTNKTTPEKLPVPTSQNGPWPSNFETLQGSEATHWGKDYNWQKNLSDALEYVNIPEDYIAAECAYSNSRTMFAAFRDESIDFEMAEWPGTFYTLYKRKKDPEGMAFDFKQGIMKFVWNEVTYYLAKMLFVDYNYEEAITFLYAPNLTDVALFCNWLEKLNQNVDDKVLAYDGGWDYSETIRKDIANARWEDIILEEDEKEEIKSNILDFFSPDGKKIYDEYGWQYRRGLLFCGKPGTGKTMTCKAAANDLIEKGVTVIYVKNINKQNGGPQSALDEIYEKANKCAPSFVVLEDIDSIVGNKQASEGLKSYFLNLLDGFECNNGVLTVATTNHPLQLDDALMERPSRFDRKYEYPVPSDALKLGYLEDNIKKHVSEELFTSVELKEAMQYIIRKSKNFTFADMKELFITAFYPWSLHGKKENLPELLTKAANLMAKQVKKTSAKIAMDMAGKNDSPVGFQRSNNE